MKNKNTIKHTLLAMLIAFLYYAWHREWIVIKFPSSKQSLVNQEVSTKTLKKNITLFFWNHNKWQHEKIELLWSDDHAKNIEHILNQWLSLLDEDQAIEKKVAVQTALISPSNYAYISFDRSPFTKEQSTHEKLLFIEGLLKTLKENGVSVQGVNFLVNHRSIEDYHLDFSNPWPLSQFSK